MGKRHKICKYVNVSFYKYCKCHTWKPFANIHKWLSKFYPAFLPHFIALDAIKVDIAFAFSHNKKQEKLKSQSVIPNLLFCGRSDCLFHSSGNRKKCLTMFDIFLSLQAFHVTHRNSNLLLEHPAVSLTMKGPFLGLLIEYILLVREALKKIGRF